MAASASLTISGTITGLPGGTDLLQPSPIQNASSPGSRLVLTLSAGANSVTVPSGTVTLLLMPPTGNAQTLTLKGVTGDTGVLLHKTFPTLLGLDTGVATVTLTAGGTITGLVVVFV